MVERFFSLSNDFTLPIFIIDENSKCHYAGSMQFYAATSAAAHNSSENCGEIVWPPAKSTTTQEMTLRHFQTHVMS